MLLGGADIKVARAEGAFLELANASKYAVAMTPNAKASSVLYPRCPAELFLPMTALTVLVLVIFWNANWSIYELQPASMI